MYLSYGQNTDTLTLATGSEKGVYYPLGQGIAEVAKKSDIKINVLSSQGSVENLYWLSKGKAQLCMAQSDTVYNAYNGLGRFTEKITNIQAIASLYTEAVHILIRNPLYIRKIDDFRGKRISIGPEGSGTESNALAILEAAGITPNEIQIFHLNSEDSVKALNEGKVDIIFFTSGYPFDVVKIMTQNKSVYFFEPNPEILQRLIDIYPFFVITAIPPGTYPNQDEDITTVGVAALLIGRDDLDSSLVYALTKSIFANRAVIESYHKKGHDIRLKSALKGIAIPLSEGADRFYEEKGIYKKAQYRKITMSYVMPALLLLLFVIAVIKFRKIRFFFKKRELARVLAVLILIWISGSMTLYYSEHRINDNYSTLFSAFWSTLINWINFGSKEPYTLIGRTTTTIMMILGVGGIAWLTGQVASIFVHKKLMGGKMRIEKMKNHYVIINWNNKGNGIIEQLRSPDLEIKPILVVTESKESPIPFESKYEDILHIGGTGASVDEMLLRKANVHLAHSVIILSDNLDKPDTADAKTILIILAIREICNKSEGKKKAPIIAEILEPQNVKLAEYAGASGGGNIEIISSQHVAQNFLAQAAVNPGLTEIYEDLLTFGEGTNEIHSYSLPSKFIGRTVDEFFKWILDLRSKNINIIPIAISRNGENYINPSKNDIKTIENGDILFAICDAKENLKRLESY
jgi:TRAP transporter TAXI family solute receptor